MTPDRSVSKSPAGIFVFTGALNDGLEWAFWLLITVWLVADLQLGASELLLLGAAYQFSGLVFETPTGLFADLVSRKRSIAVSYGLVGLATLLTVTSPNLIVLIAAFTLFAFGGTFQTGADIAWLTGELETDENFSDSKIDTILLSRHRWGLGAGCVGVIAAALIGWLSDLRVALVIVGIAWLVLGLYFVSRAPEVNFKKTKRKPRQARALLASGFRVIRSSRKLMIVLVVMLLVGFGTEVFATLGSKQFLDVADAAKDSVIVLAALYIAMIAAQTGLNLFVSAVVDRDEHAATGAGKGVSLALAAILAGTAAAGLIVAFVQNPWLAAFGLLFQESGLEMSDPLVEAWTNRETESESRATVHSIVGQFAGVANLFGLFSLGLVADAISVPWALALASAGFAAAAIVATLPAFSERHSL